jgi:hypothetical protein
MLLRLACQFNPRRCLATEHIGTWRRVTSPESSHTALNRYRVSGIRTYPCRPVQLRAGFDVFLAVLLPHDPR